MGVAFRGDTVVPEVTRGYEKAGQHIGLQNMIILKTAVFRMMQKQHLASRCSQ
jgi:hypothetical protein